MTSPESTGIYHCPACQNRTHFIGLDRVGYPGADCTCGAYGSEDGDECECHAHLTQPFTIIEVNAEGEAEDIYYDAHDGGCDSEIGSYSQISCARCEAVLWDETWESFQDWRTDHEIEEAAA